jgi:IclR family pca regulon transcriptional regulator
VTDAARLGAELDRVADQGWAVVDGELEAGLRSIAVGVRDRTGRVAAAINVSSSETRDSVEHLVQHYLPALVATADRASDELRRV